MKVLILSCNTGQGHNTAGKAVMEEFERRGVDCEMRDALAFSSELTSKVVSETYIRMATDAPKVFGKLYQASERLCSPKIKSPVYMANMACAQRMGRYIREERIDAVIAPHVFPAQALTHLKHRGQIDAKIYFVATDYTCYPFSEETDMDGYFIAHGELTDEYVERGVPGDRLIPSGIPVSERFAERVEKREARERLGLAPDGEIFLVMTGSMGAGNAGEMARRIAEEGPKESTILVMTGKNEALKQEMERLHAEDARMIGISYTTDVPLYMRAADVLITKPGGLTATEAAVARVPLVFSDPIPGCESANAHFFGRMGMAVNGGEAKDAARTAINLVRDDEWCRCMLRAQEKEISPRAAEKICDVVMSGMI